MDLNSVLGKLEGLEVNFNSSSSSMVSSVGFIFPASNEVVENPVGVLTVVFKTNKSKYFYKKVPFKVFERFVTSESYGKFLNENIKDKYTYSSESHI